MRLGLIGFPVSHSWSPRLFARFAEREGITVRYDLFPMPDVSVLRTFLLANPDIVGLNVTIPHKTAVLSLCDALHPSASRIGAVNTLLIRRNGLYGGGMHITGYNTDVGGFASALVRALTEVDSELAAAVMAAAVLPARGPAAALPAAAVPAAPGPARIFKHRRALILGSGGSARAVAWALRDLGIIHGGGGHPSGAAPVPRPKLFPPKPHRRPCVRAGTEVRWFPPQLAGELGCTACRPGPVDELLLLEPHRRPAYAPGRYRASAPE